MDHQTDTPHDTLPAAPWGLTGTGYILLYKFPRNFGIAHSPFGLYRGGFGTVMLVNYRTSNVGPYRELLFIPGRVMYPGATGYSISQIYVSTINSVIGGQKNWGIPKEVAVFDWQKTQDGGERIQVCQENSDAPFFDMTLSPILPLWTFSVNAWLLPSLVQHREGQTFITRLKAGGRAGLAQVGNVKINREVFPAIDRFQPLGALKINTFHMTFPVPKIIPDASLR